MNQHSLIGQAWSRFVVDPEVILRVKMVYAETLAEMTK